VIGGVDYESCHVAFRAFRKEKDAEAFIERIRAHDASRPRYEGEFEDSKYDRYEAALERWKKRRPIGPSITDFDSYNIHTITLV
jgi:hypothetical protein